MWNYINPNVSVTKHPLIPQRPKMKKRQKWSQIEKVRKSSVGQQPPKWTDLTFKVISDLKLRLKILCWLEIIDLSLCPQIASMVTSDLILSPIFRGAEKLCFYELQKVNFGTFGA